MAWGERSRPDPESLNPPKGVAMDERSKAFTHAVPPLRKAPQDPLALLRLHAPPRAGRETGSRRDRVACEEGAAFGAHGGGQPFPGAAVALQGKGAHRNKLP